MRPRSRVLVTALVATAVAGLTAGSVATTPSRAERATMELGRPWGSEGLERETPQLVDPSDVSRVGAATTAFAVDLYRRVAAGQPGNVVVAPYGPWLTLAMMSVGAENDTYEEFVRALRLPFPEDRLLPAVNALDRQLAERAEDADADYAVANRIFSRLYPTGYGFGPAMERHFGAPLADASFRHPEAARAYINRWVAAQTGDRIPQLIRSGMLVPETIAVPVSALYLDAPWDVPFDPGRTELGRFTGADGSKVGAEFMRAGRALPSAAGPGWRSLELPYKGGELSMLIVVPDDLAAFERRLDGRQLVAIRDRTRAGGLTAARIPRFAFATHAWLDPPLMAMGMRTTFTEGDFERMIEAGPFILGPLEHEAVIKVDEAGTPYGEGDPPAPDSSAIKVDRPFLFFVTDRPSGATLLAGRVMRPTS